MKFADAINEVRSRINIVDIIGRSVRLKRSGNNYMGLCPFHNEKTPSFVVSESKQIFKCFGCEKGGNVYTFLQEHEGMTFPEAVKYLAKQVNVTIDDDFNQNNEFTKKRDELYKLYKEVANEYYKSLFTEEGKAGLEYFLKRKLNKETIKKFGLGFAPKSYGYMYKKMKEKGYDDKLLLESKLFFLGDSGPYDFFYDRVMFPLVDSFGNVVSFQGRILEGEIKNKYINTAESIIYKKSRHLFGMNLAKNTCKDYFILCEGNMDVITLHQAGFDNAVASWGTAFTIEQANLIKRKVRKVYLCQDTDGAGIKAIEAASKICDDAGIETYVLDLNPVKDADEFIIKYGSNAFNSKLETPIPTFLFLISILKKSLDLKNPYDYKKYIETIVKRLATFDNKLVREKYTKDVAIQENLSYEDLIRQTDKYLSNVTFNISNPSFEDNNVTKINASRSDIEKTEGAFLSVLLDNVDLKDDIKNIVSVDELNCEQSKYIFKHFLEGKSANEIMDLSHELSDEDVKVVQNMILPKEKSMSNIDADNIKSTLNELIKKIKRYNIEKINTFDIKNALEKNQKLIDIDKKIYIK